MTRWLQLLPLGLIALGCTVKAETAADDPRPKNTCSDNSDCENGNCNLGVCQTPNGKIEALFVTASPASDSAIPHLTYGMPVLDVPTSGSPRDLVFPGPARITGSFELAKGDGCYPSFPAEDLETAIIPALDGKTLPAKVTLSLGERVLGLPQQLFLSSTPSAPERGSYKFELQVASGKFDVYLVPPADQIGPCQAPPQLYRNFAVEGSTPIYQWSLASVSPLDVHVHFPSPKLTGQELKGWRVDLIEPIGGNPISTGVELGVPLVEGSGDQTVDYVAALRYSAVVGTPTKVTSSEGLSELIRLRPPPGVIAPTLLFDRSATSLFEPTEAHVVGLTRFPTPVTIEGQVVRHDDGAPVSAQVFLQSTKIYGVDEGILATYQVAVAVQDDGLFEVTVPPGTYRVQAAPPQASGGVDQADALVATEASWDVSVTPSFQAGKVVELARGVATVGQSRFPGAQVRAVPTPDPVLSFDQAFGQGRFVARSASALVDDSGHFELQTDPGRFDISVQAPDALGFAWYVRPGVEVGKESRDLGRVALPLPALFAGKAVVDLGGVTAPLGSAAIRAYAYLDKDFAYTRDPKQAVSLIEVAETRAEADGSFRLLIPESIASN